MKSHVNAIASTTLLLLTVAEPSHAASDLATAVCEEMARTGKLDFNTCMHGSGPPDPDMESAMQALERCWNLPDEEAIKCMQSTSQGFRAQAELEARQAEHAARQAQRRRAIESQRRHEAAMAATQRRREADQAAIQAERQRVMETERRREAERAHRLEAEARRLEAEADVQDCYGGSYDPDPTQRRPLGEMLVQAAVFCNSDLRACLRAGANVDFLATFGTRALHQAAGNHCEDHVGALTAAGAKVNVKNNMGNTPLHEATDHPIGFDGPIIGTVRALLAAGADVNSENNDGDTPLFGVGVPRAFSDIRQALDSDTVSLIAHPSESDRRVAEILVRAGADPCAQNALGWIAYPRGCLRQRGLAPF